MAANIKFFRSRSALRTWLEKNHESATELWVGFHRKDSGKPSIAYSEALDEALCFGWIDGVRHKVDETGYTNRFSPRKPGSVWSLINIRRVQQLTKLGLMRPPGVAAFDKRDEKKSLMYSYERKKSQLDEAFENKFRANKPAWKYFEAQSPWYRRTATWWVISAKREETRAKRLATLIEDSAHERRLAILTPKARRS